MQVGTVIYNSGITEARAREIFSEMFLVALKENTAEAEEKAIERIRCFENVLFSKMVREDAMLSCFSDPAFQVLLKKVQLESACTEREDDYNILSELLVNREKDKANIKKKASISKAVEIVNQIDDDSLLALTVLFSIEKFIPISGDIEIGLSTISDLFSKFNLNNLPKDNLWIDNLSILGAINSNAFGRLKKFEDYYSNKLCGYMCVGIEKESENYFKALELLNSCGLRKDVLQDNILIEGYVRLPIISKEEIGRLVLRRQFIENGENKIFERSVNEKEVACLEKVFDLYSNDSIMLSQVKNSFIELLNSYDPISRIIKWWNSIPVSITLTSVGRAIGYSYAKCIDPQLPDFEY